MSDHILRVTRAADDENEAEYEIVCPHEHPNDICTVWWECMECTTKDGLAELIEDLCEQDEIELHGVTHMYVAGYVCTQGSTCIARTGDTEYDIDPDRLPVGDHPIEYEHEDGLSFVTFPALKDVKFPDKETR